MHSMSICFNSYLLHFSNSILFYRSFSLFLVTTLSNRHRIRTQNSTDSKSRTSQTGSSVRTISEHRRHTTTYYYDFAGSIRTPPRLFSSTTIDIRGGGGAVCNTDEFYLLVSSSRTVFRRGEEKPTESWAIWDAHLLCEGGDRIDASTRQQKRFNMKIQGIFLFFFLLR